MKKTLSCILLCAAVLCTVCSCGISNDGTQTTQPQTSEAVSVTVTEDNRPLMFRYFYLSSWRKICMGIINYRVQVGVEAFDVNTSPDEQYYVETEGAEPILWSDELSLLAVDAVNRAEVLYDDAMANGYELGEEYREELKKTLDLIVENAAKESVTPDEHLESTYGDGMTLDIYTQIITLELTASSYESYLIDKFMIERTDSSATFEECSELAEVDSSDYIDELLNLNQNEFHVDDVDCVKGGGEALTFIKRYIVENPYN